MIVDSRHRTAAEIARSIHHITTVGDPSVSHGLFPLLRSYSNHLSRDHNGLEASHSYPLYTTIRLTLIRSLRISHVARQQLERRDQAGHRNGPGMSFPSLKCSVDHDKVQHLAFSPSAKPVTHFRRTYFSPCTRQRKGLYGEVTATLLFIHTHKLSSNLRLPNACGHYAHPTYLRPSQLSLASTNYVALSCHPLHPRGHWA